MDGLLVDTEPLWSVAQVELAERLGTVWRPEIKARIVGTRLGTAVPLMLEGLEQPTTPEAVEGTSQWLLGRMVELFEGDLVALPGALPLLAALQRAGVPVALVSSSYRVLVDAVLRRVGAGFDLTLAGDEVEHAKPHPEPYATACRRLGADPAASVVLEDSPAGVVSGLAAGCAVVAVPSVAGVEVESGPRCRVAASLAEVDLDVLSRLVAPG